MSPLFESAERQVCEIGNWALLFLPSQCLVFASHVYSHCLQSQHWKFFALLTSCRRAIEICPCIRLCDTESGLPFWDVFDCDELIMYSLLLWSLINWLLHTLCFCGPQLSSELLSVAARCSQLRVDWKEEWEIKRGHGSLGDTSSMRVSVGHW